MAAANTDLFLKVAANTGWQLGASGISDAIVTSFSLVSATGLPTDTAVLLTIDRVDGSGTKTPSKMERIVGVVSGNNIVSVIRGVEGTAQAHAGGAVVEIVISAANFNKYITAMIAGHNQDGTFKNICSLASYAPSGAGTTTIYPTLAKINTITMPATTQTIAVSGAVAGQFFVVEINNVTSQGALTWFTTIKWADGITPSLCGVNGKRDVFGFRCTGTDTYDGFVIGQNI